MDLFVFGREARNTVFLCKADAHNKRRSMTKQKKSKGSPRSPAEIAARLLQIEEQRKERAATELAARIARRKAVATAAAVAAAKDVEVLFCARPTPCACFRWLTWCSLIGGCAEFIFFRGGGA